MIMDDQDQLTGAIKIIFFNDGIRESQDCFYDLTIKYNLNINKVSDKFYRTSRSQTF
ncbi:hypothetical protein pb186bvf_003017 [Paramecium bursaria]